MDVDAAVLARAAEDEQTWTFAEQMHENVSEASVE